MNNTGEQRTEPPGVGWPAVLAVLTPVLFGTAGTLFLLIGSALRALAPGQAFAKTMLTTGWVFGALTAGAILTVAAALLIGALRSNPQAVEEESPAARRTVHPGGRAARRTLDFASFVAGNRRAHLREEWSAVLAGDPENGLILSSRRRMRYALGFLWAAFRMRLRELAAPLWTPVDWLLSAESRTRGLIAFGVGAQVVYIRHQDGLHALVTEGWGWCAGCGIALRLFVSWLRRVRGIELASMQSGSTDR